MKVALYARYSTDNQRDASIEDQFRMCRLRAEKEGWQIVEEYSDHAISGASLLRPGIQALISDATRGKFDLILAEAMDRLSRDQEDIAGFFKRMSYCDVTIFTLSEGGVSHLHVGLKGTMNALFLKDLADKTRRGQRGRVEAGKSGGGNAYGYDVIKKFDANGEPIRGDRTINEAQAKVIERIFRDYTLGKSAKTIAFALNKEGIPAPGGGDWGFSTINGNPKRGNGILNNEMYVGKIVWNRQRFVKDPDTGRRQARPNPESEWITQDVPELRILNDDLWQAVKARQTENRIERNESGSADIGAINTRRRPKYLFSGLTKCACCGEGYSAISATLIGCELCGNLGDGARLSGGLRNGLGALDTVDKFDAADELGQLIFALETALGSGGGHDQLEDHQLGGRRRQGPLGPGGAVTNGGKNAFNGSTYTSRVVRKCTQCSAGKS